MTKTNTLLRRPRPPKLHKVDLTNIEIGTPVATLIDGNLSSNSSSRTGTPLSSDREFVVPSLYVPEATKTVTTLPLLTPKNTQLALKSYQEKYEKSLHDSEKHEAMSEHARVSTFTKTNYYDDEDKNLLNLKTLSRTTYKRLLSISPPKRTTANRITSNKSLEELSRIERAHLLREYSQFNNSRNSALRPYKSLGPDPLPARQPKRFEDRRKKYENLTYYEKEEEELKKKAPFTLNDFILDRDEDQISPLEKTEFIKSILSTKNYKGFCKALDEKMRADQNKNNDKVHVQTLMPDMEPFEHRIPLRQIIIEMASYLKKELSEKMGVNLKAKLNQLPKWQNLQGAHTEIIVYEDENEKNARHNTHVNDDSQITVTQLAIVDALLRNGLALSLKGHFIDKLPDLTTLEKTLIYINLSFNMFEELPNELLNMPQLEAIKLRNNPLNSLPLELNQLTNLKILTLSYCKIDTEIPKCVFMLPNLRFLDVSYNSIKYISKRIINLNSLKNFNCEGNELYYLPCTMLSMENLVQINVKNNYLHPMFWKDTMCNNPQRLFDLAALATYQNYYLLDLKRRKLKPDLEYVLQKPETCDCCGAARFGEGLKLIKPCVKIFGVKYMPFMFQCCSPLCLNRFKRQKSFYSDT